jgi:glycosyltransferase involved in cell wall biosynthesis
MKIGIDARMLGYSGIGRYAENLIREILQIDKKNQYVVFVQKDKEGFKKFINPKSKTLNLKVIEVDAPIYSFKEQSNFLKAVNREKLDVMHFTHFNRPIFYNRPSVVTIHDLTPIYFPGKKRKSLVEQSAYRLVLKTALKKSSKIIAVSNFTKKDILKNFPFINDKKIKVIYEGINFATTVKLKIKNKKQKNIIENWKLGIGNYLLYVGVWREHKNLIGLIRAFEKLKFINHKSKFLNLKLVIVGKPDPYYPEVPEAARNSSFKKDIILTGYVADEDLPALYQNAEVFVFPSFYEGFGLPPLEAMAFGCPVVSSNATSLPEVLGEAAVYFDPYNIDEMASKIAQVLSDRDLQKSLIEKGRKQVLKYSWRKMAEETVKVYNSINVKCQSSNVK